MCSGQNIYQVKCYFLDRLMGLFFFILRMWFSLSLSCIIYVLFLTMRKVSLCQCSVASVLWWFNTGHIKSFVAFLIICNQRIKYSYLLTFS